MRELVYLSQRKLCCRTGRPITWRPWIPLTRAHLTRYRELFEPPTPEELAQS